MTNRDTIPPGAVLVALDIAKLRNEVLIEMPGQQRRRRLSVLNNRTEHDRLIDILGSLTVKLPLPDSQRLVLLVEDRYTLDFYSVREQG